MIPPILGLDQIPQQANEPTLVVSADDLWWPQLTKQYSRRQKGQNKIVDFIVWFVTFTNLVSLSF